MEDQHQISTRKLVGSDAEHRILEELIDAVKPPARAPPRLHYLLSTPFRYPPLRHGSRFGSRHDPGIWYGAEGLDAALAEVAYYRLLFLEGTSAELDGVETGLTAFRAHVASERGVDLTGGCFATLHTLIASPVSYRDTQPLGVDMRAGGVAAFRYPSARWPGGVCTAVFDPSAFARRTPHGLESWHCTGSRSLVEMRRRDYFRRRTAAFPREAFLVEGRLPAPGLG